MFEQYFETTAKFIQQHRKEKNARTYWLSVKDHLSL
jgi:hypothetical protein